METNLHKVILHAKKKEKQKRKSETFDIINIHLLLAG